MVKRGISLDMLKVSGRKREKKKWSWRKKTKQEETQRREVLKLIDHTVRDQIKSRTKRGVQ